MVTTPTTGLIRLGPGGASRARRRCDAGAAAITDAGDAAWGFGGARSLIAGPRRRPAAGPSVGGHPGSLHEIRSRLPRPSTSREPCDVRRRRRQPGHAGVPSTCEECHGLHHGLRRSCADRPTAQRQEADYLSAFTRSGTGAVQVGRSPCRPPAGAVCNGGHRDLPPAGGGTETVCSSPAGHDVERLVVTAGRPTASAAPTPGGCGGGSRGHRSGRQCPSRRVGRGAVAFSRRGDADLPTAGRIVPAGRRQPRQALHRRLSGTAGEHEEE
jgi:hypothetical protein